MTDTSRSTLLRYGGAGFAVLLATAARLALDPVLGDLFPFATLFFAVLLVAGYGGRGPALLATGLGAAVSARLLLPPRARDRPANWPRASSRPWTPSGPPGKPKGTEAHWATLTSPVLPASDRNWASRR
jgi:hypothetical protein